ncbi:MAG: hypothetical protein PHD72_04290 [Patescibacteria group bacterium]|nr:hypothetical protein [Patescibacteria group bacterium]
MDSHDIYKGGSPIELGINNYAEEIGKLRDGFIERYDMTPDRKEKISTMLEHVLNFLDSRNPELIDARTDAFEHYKAEQEAALNKLQVKGVVAEVQPFSISNFLSVVNHPIFGIKGKDRFLDAWIGHIQPPTDESIAGFSSDDKARQTEIYKEYEVNKLERIVTSHLQKRLAAILNPMSPYNDAWSQSFNTQNGSMHHAACNIGFALLFATQKEKSEVILDASLAVVDLITTGPFPPLQGWPTEITDGINRYYALTK